MRVEIGASNQFGKLERANLETFEHKLGVTLPEAYRRHLLQHNGSRIEGTDEAGGVHFFGLHDGPEWGRLPNLTDFRIVTGHSDLLPMGDDAFGNYFCIALFGPNRGQVCLWDHDPPGITVMAPDFDSFVGGIATKIALSRGEYSDVLAVVNEVGVNTHVYGGKTVLDLAFELADLAIIEKLVSMGGTIRPDALIEAVRNDALDTVRFLLSQKVDVNYILPETGFTALMLAGSCGRSEAFDLLLAHGANPALRNRWGKTAVDLASGNGQGDFV